MLTLLLALPAPAAEVAPAAASRPSRPLRGVLSGLLASPALSPVPPDAVSAPCAGLGCTGMYWAVAPQLHEGPAGGSRLRQRDLRTWFGVFRHSRTVVI